MRQHAFAIEAEADEGVARALAWAEKELGMSGEGNPDISVLKYGLFSVADARRVSELAAGGAFAGESKVVIIAASRAYHEAQNALLKIFEEPPAGVYLFLIMPTLGGLLPTLRSRVQIIGNTVPRQSSGRKEIAGVAEQFLSATKEQRSAIIKRLTSGKDDEKKRELRDEAIALINGIEAAALDVGFTKPYIKELLEDIATLRPHLYDRSAPVKMILEHLAIVTPRGLSVREQV